jgi:TolB-like protein/Flp pilus assembly protein TadD
MEQLLELARARKLDRIGATYAVVAWVLVQAASIALPAFSAPAWALRWLIFIAMAGFPIALVLAWLSTRHTARVNVIAPRALDTRDWLLFGLIGLVAVLLIVQLTFEFTNRAPIGAPPALQAQIPISSSSVAVLPFANLSGDASKVYFSDGIADQLISELSRTSSLRVAARSSSFAFRGKDVDVKTIAKALNVRTVLEGSVREAGNRVRIAAELVDATNGFQIWSESYDRDLTNILALQDDIARAITEAVTQRFLGHRVTPPRVHAKPQAIDPEAYKAYLQGQYYFAQRTREGVARAATFFTRVTELAPGYAEGFAALADVESASALNFADPTHLAPALSAVNKALALDPNNATALVARVRILLLQWQWRAAADDIRRLENSHVNSAAVWRTRAVFFDYMGLPDLAHPAEIRAVQLDPLSFIDHYNLALYTMMTKRYDEAMMVANEAAALQPGNTEILSLKCHIAVQHGKIDQAKEFYRLLAAQTKSGEPPGDAVACQFNIAVAEKHFDVAHKIADAASAAFPASGISTTDVGIGYTEAGDLDSAIKWFRKALELRDPQMLRLPYAEKQLVNLFADPRWKALRAEAPIRDWEAARLEFAREFQRGE